MEHKEDFIGLNFNISSSTPFNVNQTHLTPSLSLQGKDQTKDKDRRAKMKYLDYVFFNK